jgi:hypothetical protein
MRIRKGIISIVFLNILARYQIMISDLKINLISDDI